MRSLGHNLLRGEIAAIIGNHSRDSAGVAVLGPGVVPRVRADCNFCIPDVGVTGDPVVPDGYILPNPILLVEILSPSNQSETWSNVWTYTTIPSVQEIFVVRTSSTRADLLRRRPDGSWPEVPEMIVGGTPMLGSIGLAVELTALYRGTRQAAA